MKLNLLDVNKFIKENGCAEVTNPVFFQGGSLPTEDGLFSSTIFGNIGSKDRSTKFGYISLGDYFLAPAIYKLLITLDRNIGSLIAGSRFVSLDSKGYLVDDENGETGLDFLYKNWEKIKFKASDSNIRTTKLRILYQTPKNQIFVDKWIVLPAMLRDYNPSKQKAGAMADYDVINDIYAKIIRNSISLQNSTMMFVKNNTKYTIQNLLLEIYMKLVDNDLSGKNGLFRKGLMGKSIDYATRSVITAPNMYSQTYDSLEVPFGYTGIPMSQLVVLFYPFYLKYINDFIDIHREEFSRVKVGSEVIEIENLQEQFSDTSIKKLLDGYIRNIEGRFDSIKVAGPDGKYYPVDLFDKELGHRFTVTDLIYLASMDICSDKHVFVTRYPVENFQNIYPSKITVLSTKKTREVILNGRILKNFPVVYPDYPTTETIFYDSVKISNLYAKALGADYDGDMTSIRGVYTQEANLEADRLVRAKTMLLNQTGSSSRKIGNDGVLALYSLTK